MDASRLAEVASYIPRWIFSTAINLRLAVDSSTPFGVANRIDRHLRMDAWMQAVHCRHLAVRARSIIGADAATRSISGTEDVIRNLSSTGRNRWSLVSTRKIPVRCLPADDPTIGTICAGAHARQDGTNPTDQIVYGGPCADERRLHAISHVQLLRHSKNLDVQIASGVCAAILTWTFTLGATDWPGAFSLFCCGPQVIEAATSGGKDANKQTNSLIQKQLKTTDPTTGLSDKDMKSITKFGFTIPGDFFELACLVQNMAGG